MDPHILLIELFESKDKHRRRYLYEIFADKINTNASRKFIAQWINRELARDDLISEADIKYCRHYFKTPSNRPTLPPIPANKHLMPRRHEQETERETEELTWTDPDEDGFQKHSIKSKFSRM